MHDSSQTGLVATKRRKEFKSLNDILQGLTIQHFHFCENYENSSYLFLMYRIYAKNCYVFCLYFSKLEKIKKMFDRQSLVNVRLKIRTKFHSNRLVRFRDILHNVSKNLVSRKTLKFKVSERHFSYVSFTYFFHLYIAFSQFLQFTTKLNPNPLIFDSPKSNI